ncbi:hypothetical protein GDO81_025929 [Engystomops pustulosus]|uniref:Secreted protein n=1 Tax=Engystomops pustulosus TaxID=76066 RepID=A0AAV6ZJ24_ENGPU|nr:hypothetical protein GDO81_025929 [Engystomops pustulosus]
MYSLSLPWSLVYLILYFIRYVSVSTLKPDFAPDVNLDSTPRTCGSCPFRDFWLFLTVRYLTVSLKASQDSAPTLMLVCNPWSYQRPHKVSELLLLKYRTFWLLLDK